MKSDIIAVRFDAMTDESPRAILYTELLQVPDNGEIVNILGHPFVVNQRSWAVGDEKESDGHTLYAYVTVVPYKPLPPDFFEGLVESWTSPDGRWGVKK